MNNVNNASHFLGLLTARADWMIDAECRGMDPNIFFIEIGHSADRALQVCKRCPVAQQCLEYALNNHLRHGVWGGKTEHQRRTMGLTR